MPVENKSTTIIPFVLFITPPDHPCPALKTETPRNPSCSNHSGTPSQIHPPSQFKPYNTQSTNPHPNPKNTHLLSISYDLIPSPHRHPCSAPCPIRQKVPQLHIHASLQPPTLPPFSSFHSQEPHKTTPPPPENSHIHKNHPVSISSQNFQYTRHLIKLLCSEFSERD
ncbi:hypothetical protein J0A71_09g18760 [Encephalitozoon cuniculi]|nr:hypothetical protein J0A71_09g18760 [Encephalitozoon cuniculi]